MSFHLSEFKEIASQFRLAVTKARKARFALLFWIVA